MAQQVTRFTAVMYEDQIARLNEANANRAAATRDCVDRYFFIIDHAKKSVTSKLTESELEAIADLFGSFAFFDLRAIPNHFHEILRAELLARGQADYVDIAALTDKLAEMTIAEKFALIHEAEVRERKSRLQHANEQSTRKHERS